MTAGEVRAADLPVGSVVANVHTAWIKFSVGEGGADGGWLATGNDLSTYDFEPQEALDAGAEVLRVGDGQVDTCITCQDPIAADEPAEQDSPAGGRWHTRCAEQCPNCASPYRHQRFVMPTAGGTEVCGREWHNGGTVSLAVDRG